MAIPSIHSIVPAVVPTSGSVLVEIVGAGFRSAELPRSEGTVSSGAPTMEVWIGGRPAREVRVYADDRLSALVPAGNAGARDVVIRNLGPDGAPVPGEQAVARDALTYVRPDLAAEAELTRVVRTLLQELKRQVVDSVVLTVHTDVAEETGDELHVATLPQLPGLVLLGPELVEDRFYSLNQSPEQSEGDGQFSRRRVPYTVDLGFSVVGVSHHTTELLNLMAATQLFFHKNAYLEMDRDAGDAGAGRVRYEMDVARDGDLKVTSTPNESNVRSFSGRIVVRGFDLEELAGGMNESVVERGTVASAVRLDGPNPIPPRPQIDASDER